jgi:inorganic pyrophosphatase
VIEVSMSKAWRIGDIKHVKVLGSICLLDQGELDWKVIGLNLEEAQDKRIRNIEDFNRQNPGALGQIQEWLRTYKVYEGKGENQFGYGGKILSAERTIEIIHENNGFYQDLKAGKVENKSGLWLGKNL